jgi:hypothetical protein
MEMRASEDDRELLDRSLLPSTPTEVPFSSPRGAWKPSGCWLIMSTFHLVPLPSRRWERIKSRPAPKLPGLERLRERPSPLGLGADRSQG